MYEVFRVVCFIGLVYLFFCSECFSRVIESPSAQRWAIVIGNEDYEKEAIWPRLDAATQDAASFRTFLRARCGWNMDKSRISYLLDQKKDSLKKNVKQFLLGIPNPDQAIVYFYYSGHGVENGMVPTDSKGVDDYLSYKWLKDTLENLGIGHKVYIIDACNSGSFLYKKALIDRVKTKGLVRKGKRNNPIYKDDILFNKAFDYSLLTQDENYVLFASTDQYKDSWSKKHMSLFTETLLEQLDEKSNDVDSNGVLDEHEINLALRSELPMVYRAEHLPVRKHVFNGNAKFPLALISSRKDLVKVRTRKLSRAEIDMKYEMAILYKDEKSYDEAFIIFS